MEKRDPSSDDWSHLAAAAAALDDIEERSRLYRAVLRILAEQFPAGVVVASSKPRRGSHFSVWNRRARMIIGKDATRDPPEDWPAAYRLRRINGDPIESSDLPLVRAMLGEPCVEDLRLTRPDGTEVEIRVRGIPVVVGGEPIAGVAIFREIG